MVVERIVVGGVVVVGTVVGVVVGAVVGCIFGTVVGVVFGTVVGVVVGAVVGVVVRVVVPEGLYTRVMEPQLYVQPSNTISR